MDVSPTAMYTDFSDLHDLKYDKSVDEKTRLKAVAKQFEGIFVQMMLKSMRDANMGDDLFDSDQSRMYQDLFDKQISLELSNNSGIGLADMMVKQMDNTLPGSVETGKTVSEYRRTINNISGNNISENITRSTAYDQGIKLDNRSVAITENSPGQKTATDNYETKTGQLDDIQQKPWVTPDGFIEHMMPHARAVAGKLGLHPAFIVAQAALETGWGSHVMKNADGNSSNNLFGIKAGKAWKGDTALSNTLEYRDGIMKQEKAVFRSYSSVGEAFRDYARLLSESPRYSNVMNSGNNVEQFSNNLSRAGYATDPVYAEKIKTIVQSDRMKPFMNDGF